MTTLDRKSHPDLLVLSGSVVVTGAMVFVHPDAIAGTAKLGVFSAIGGDGARRVLPVRVLSCTEIPGGALAIAQQLADELELATPKDADYRLELDGFASLVAEEVGLLSIGEASLEQAASALNETPCLGGRLLFVHKDGRQLAPGTMQLAGAPYQIAGVLPRNSNVIYEITEKTRLKLRAPRARSGVDLVILADCSGSMGDTDLLDEAKRRRVSRIDALKAALKTIGKMWQSAGPSLRIALVSFTTQCEVRFPDAGGMQEIRPGEARAVLNRFADAVDDLQPTDAQGTDIAQALHVAAELLQLHGKSGNDKLIILISDGAHWVDADEETSIGKTVRILEEPVSLMRQLRKREHVHLHCVGISNEPTFRMWWQMLNPGQAVPPMRIPRHDLLKRLAEAGDGQFVLAEDAAQLSNYFEQLAAGVTLSLASQAVPPPPLLQDSDRQLFREHAQNLLNRRQAAQVSPECLALAQEIRELYRSCNELAMKCTGHTLFSVDEQSTTTLLTALQQLDPNRITETADALHQTFRRQIADEQLPFGMGPRLDEQLAAAWNETSLEPMLRALRDGLWQSTQHLDTVHRALSPAEGPILQGFNKLKPQLFYSYCHADEVYVHALATHLGVLKSLGLCTNLWSKTKRLKDAGNKVGNLTELKSSQIILLLISPDYIGSEPCLLEMHIALRRYQDQKARVVPILLRPVLAWKQMPFASLQILPKDERPVTMHAESTVDAVWLKIGEDLLQVIAESEPSRLR